MVPRRVIADSDDEDEDGNTLSPLREDERIDPPEVPEVEPLSPHHRPSTPDVLDNQNQISDTTDQSFFANIYDEQQNRALQNSYLVENIVRQSQQASRSSGEVSLPAKGKGRKLDISSITNVTSPALLKRPGNHLSLLSECASGVTTPQKSVPGEWDVPSSAEDAMTPRTTKSSKWKNEKSYGKRKKSQSRSAKNSAAAEIFMGYDGPEQTTQDTNPYNEMLTPNRGIERSPQPVLKPREVSLHDSVIPETAPVANFYIAQSNLTTMQKLEYEKVNVSQNAYSGLPNVPMGSIKSSGVSTIAYPTPSRYASSSGPPLPWEKNLVADNEPDENVNFVNTMSSPDVITTGHDRTGEKLAEATLVDTQVPYDEIESPVKNPIPRSTSSKRKKRTRSIQDEDEDELQDGSHEPIDLHQSKSKRRRNELKLNPPDSHGDDIERLPSPHEEVPQEQGYRDPPGGEICETVDTVPEIPATEPPISPSMPEHSPLETEPAPQPKKRGRKKKKTTGESAAQEELPIESQTIAEEITPAITDREVQAELDKPKKKRGRPRKSGVAKSEVATAPECESDNTHKTHEDDAQRSESILEAAKSTERPKLTKKQKVRNQIEKEIEETTPDQDDTDGALKEIDSNFRPSEEPVSAEDVSTKPTPKPLVDQRRSEEKGSTASKPMTTTSTPSQAKVPYRVGLSKRTRITSLLKIIKR
ncbi:hypothetical protein F5Y11DRAFT_333136 [Daldinia sp. FL1419]|nr:hypothetical protein F5Y11DRAFT_333136 [Daldinia sp. FL1419]